MINPQEHKQGYLSKTQREVLLQLLTEPTIERHFFLTGGTALAVFYLAHRVSNDLDLFSRTSQNLADLHFWIKGIWPRESVVIKQSSNFLSCLIRETKVDLVIDPLSIEEERPSVGFENAHRLHVDTIQSIVSNKLCACVSRTEPKDFVDLYVILKKFPEMRIETVYAGAQAKDAIFDDPPTAAFQLEEGLAFIQEQPEILPPLQFAFDYGDFLAFYENLTMWIYGRLTL
jgi:hypothetical protein